MVNAVVAAAADGGMFVEDDMWMDDFYAFVPREHAAAQQWQKMISR